MFELRVPFFIPLWRRIAVTAACFAWALFEYMNGAPLWAALFGVIGAFVGWQFFLTGWPGNEEGGAGED